MMQRNGEHNDNRRQRPVPLRWLPLTVATLLTLLLAVSGCNRQTIYSHYVATGTYGWCKTDSAVFTVGPVRQDGDYDEQLELRLTDLYPYTDIAVAVVRQVTPGNRLFADTLMVTLTDDRGRATGQGIHHRLYHLDLPRVTLVEGETMRVAVTHLMTETILQGITDVGLTVVRP